MLYSTHSTGNQAMESPVSNTARKTAVEVEIAVVSPSTDPVWYRQSHLLCLNYIIVSLVLFSSANGYDGSLMNGLQALNEWNRFMDYPTGVKLGWINAIVLLGSGVGSPIAAWLSNRFGRKPGLYGGYMFLILGSVLQTASPNPTAFLLARLFMGVASGLFGVAAPLLINEIAHPRHRGIVNSLVSGWVIFGVRSYSSSWSWRLPSLLQALLPAVALPGLLLAPESPRWLISQGREDEARAILTRYHAGGCHSSLVDAEFQEIRATIQAEQDAHKGASYVEMLRTPGNRHRLIISLSLGFFAQWVGNGVISYYLALILNTVGVTSVRDQTLILACMQMWNLLFAIVGSVLIDRFGRRPLFLSSAVIMLASYVVVTALSSSFAVSRHAATGVAVIPFLFIFFAGYGVAVTPLLTAYPCEIWPFRLRSRGLAVTWMSTICAAFFNIFVNPIALEAIAWKYYLIFIAVLLLFGVTAYFLYPETKGYTLEQVAVVFDGPGRPMNDLETEPNSSDTASDPKGVTSATHRETI
ncbi:general substrate transporter [Aspergillus novofumigatus IBT 16806]|uniref:General substrate transporter n=1 Tax=Aspergillus novofumigatus (strain IBT 16806) TaxID=1392255 RepID=A0A2I1C7E8_ASPN1|nr:general substrate transporter [Aspergillus novofumigatus IBT 16806]PKX93554.1 general substrate transporter [Aspergillus novofumigatus IBT 16806]